MAQNEGAPESTQTGALVWLIVAMVIGIVLYLSYYFTNAGGKKKKEKRTATAAAVAQNEGPRAAAGPAGRRPRRMRVQRREDEEDEDDFDFGGGGSSDEGEILDQTDGKIGAKKKRKLEMKAEKKAEREAVIEEREERKKHEALLAVEREKDAKLRDAEEQQKAEELRILKEKKEQEEHEEYLKLKESFIVEESGEIGVLSEEESQALLQEFIDYVKESKVNQLEDLALHFNLKTQEIIERLENLQEMGRITGVMDDRGKFIYISEEELQAVASFVKRRGRISITELAECSNTLIKLQEKEKPSTVVEASA